MSEPLRVALTFDAEHPDRPHHGEHASWILDELARLGVRATVFLQGRWVEANPRLARRIADEGHLVGNHTFYHARMPLLTDVGFDEDVREAERVIREATGVDPRPWLRFPFGAGADEAALVDRLGSLGYRHVGWDVELYEWAEGASAHALAEAAVKAVRRIGDGALVLLHTWPDPVAPVVAEIVDRLREHGATFVGVDELHAGPGLDPIGTPRPAMLAAGGG